MLAARAVPRCQWEDLLQQVAEKVLSTGVRFSGTDDLEPWAATVLRRLHIDLVRRDARLDLRTDPPVVIDEVDPSRHVVARLDLEAIERLIAAMSPEDQAILNGAPSPSRSANAAYIRRHRLRAQLRAAIEATAAFVLFWWRRIRMSANSPVTGAALNVVALAPVVLFSASADELRHGHDPVTPVTWVDSDRGDAARRAIDVDVVGAAPANRTERERSEKEWRPRFSAQRLEVEGTGTTVELEDSATDEPLWRGYTPLVGSHCLDDPRLPAGIGAPGGG